MPTLLTHIHVKPEAIARWEAILRVLVERTHAEEADVMRYEYWRGQEPGLYYALLAYRSSEDFYTHQAADYHDDYLDDFATMFSDMRLEWVDPVAGSDLVPTENEPLPATAADKLHAQVPLYPIALATWWREARRAAPS